MSAASIDQHPTITRDTDTVTVTAAQLEAIRQAGFRAGYDAGFADGALAAYHATPDRPVVVDDPWGLIGYP